MSVLALVFVAAPPAVSATFAPAISVLCTAVPRADEPAADVLAVDELAADVLAAGELAIDELAADVLAVDELAAADAPAADVGTADAPSAAADREGSDGGSPAGPSPSPAAPGAVEGEFELSFAGSSTLHEFSGSAPRAAFRAESRGGSGELWDAELSVPVAALSTGNGIRDRNMRSMFAADRHPLIRVSLTGVSPQALRPDGDAPGRLELALTIGAVTRNLAAVTTEWSEQEGRLSFAADFDVSLADFGLEAPSVLFVKVRDRVRVHVSVNARAAE